MRVTNSSSSGYNRLSELRIDENRLWRRHTEIARIGTIEGDGNRRLAMTQEDGAARDLFRSWCEQAGLTVRIDRAGNMFAVRPGTDTSAPMIVSGSHLDTQPHGGRFDGISGVLTALEVVETLNDASVATTAPIAIVNWTNEEGVRFSPGLMGSSWFAGRLSDEDLLGAISRDGQLFEDEARSIGYLGNEHPSDFRIGAYYELHIEQGPILENQQRQIGVVESVQGLHWLDVSVSGQDAHAGTTPMELRRDTIQASARILVAINELSHKHAPDARVSVGYIKPHTDGVSTICGQTDFVIDIRHPDQHILNQLMEDCRNLCTREAQSHQCKATVNLRISVQPGEFDPACVSNIENATISLGYPHMRMASGALHDACNMMTATPSAMIFVPCKDGLSHNVEESAKPEDLAAGCNVLLHAILASAE